jgi:adenine-specific DNA methylase
MLLGLLLPDPCDAKCPVEFKTKAAKALFGVPGYMSDRMKKQLKSDEGLRKALLTFIGEMANWDVANNLRWIGAARELVKAAYLEDTPLVVDPFAGGGSIPLEALRLGCETFASDLNPIACLILKVMLEDIPRHGPELAEELLRVGGEIRKQAEKELAEFYPKDPDGATPIAYLWARTVKCESPNCGAEIPLLRSFWLCSKANRRCALRYRILRPNGKLPEVELEVFKPKNENDIPGGTVSRAKATCPSCNIVLAPKRVRAQLAEQDGGADTVFDSRGNRTGGARMLAVVTLNSGTHGRNYRLPTERDYQAVWKAQKRLKEILDEWERGGKKSYCPVPDEPTPAGGGSGAGRAFSVQKYGMMKFSDLFTARQKAMLVCLLNLVNSLKQEPVEELLTFVFEKLTDKATSLCRWKPTAEYMGGHTFSRPALPIVWDWCEAQPFAGASGGWEEELVWIVKVIQELTRIRLSPAQVQQADACESPLPSESVSVYFTDPPYYDAIPYSDLSDFFLVWTKRILPGNCLLRDPFDPSNPLSPKLREAVQDETKIVNGCSKDRLFFEHTMSKAFAEGCRILRADGVGSVVFAHKTTEGWEALLSGMIIGGWVITASWPIATEMSSRLRAMESAALATSVHLVCRPRPDDAMEGDWSEVLRQLPRRVGDWMERLQGEGIRGADLVFACIGPALEIFSRYRKVETADGREVKLAEYLEKVWEAVGRTALEQVLGTAEAKARNGAAGAVEEDARLTALFLWTLQSTNGENGSSQPAEGSAQTSGEPDEESEEDLSGADDGETTPKVKIKGYSLVFDVVRRFAQPLGIELPKWEGRIIETKKGVVRLMAVSERAKQLFGEDGADAVADWIEHDPTRPIQQVLFPEFEEEQAPKIRGRGRGRRKVTLDLSAAEGDSTREATTLDRVHAAMLLQAGGQSNALRALIKAEQERGPDFLRLANALSALYPKNSEEKRLLDAMLLAVPR